MSNAAREERNLSALAHTLAILPPLGVILGLGAYVRHKDDNHELAFQGVQAAAYQVLISISLVAIWMLWGWAYATIFIPTFTAVDPVVSAPPAPVFSFASLSVPVLVWLMFGVAGILAGQRINRGIHYRYPILGAWLEQRELVDPPRDMV